MAAPSTSTIEVPTRSSSPHQQLSWSIMPNSNITRSTLHLHDNDSRRTIHSPSPTARNSRASSMYNDGCEKMSLGSHSKQIAAKPLALYTQCSQSLQLENTASVARDHLANERTFLAWLRTSISLITVGVAITQLYNLSSNGDTQHQKMGQALGVVFVGLSLLFLYFGNARYFHAQHAMCKGYFPASRGSVLVASGSVLGMLLSMLVIMAVDRGTS